MLEGRSRGFLAATTAQTPDPRARRRVCCGHPGGRAAAHPPRLVRGRTDRSAGRTVYGTPGRAEGLLFEVVSALGTVGLTTGITPTLTPGGKLIVLVLMFVGRLGPLTVAMAVARTKPRPAVRLAEEPLMIG